MNTNEFDDSRIIKELKNINYGISQILLKMTELVEYITTEPKEVLSKEKVEKDFSDLKEKVRSFTKKVEDEES